MTALAHPALRGPANGGVAARRALVRWAWRMFRREWRQQILVVALLAVAVAAAIGSITLVYNTSPAFDGEFGSASGLLMFTAPIRWRSRQPWGRPRSRSGRRTSSATARCPSRAGSRRWTSVRRPRMGPTAAISSRSAVAATRLSPARSPSPRVWPSSSMWSGVEARSRRAASDRRRHRREPTRSQ